MTDDPFMAAAAPLERRPGDFKRDKHNTPWVSDPSGALVKPKRKSDEPRVKWVRYSRPSGFGDQIENSYNLTKWSERQLVLGVAIGGFELDEAMKSLLPPNQDDKDWRELADSVARRCKDIAKADLAADRGTHAHAITEDDDADRDWITRAEAGENLGMPIEAQQGLVDAWRIMLIEYGLEVVASELPVVHDGYRCAGTLDRIVRLTRDLLFNIDGRDVFLRAGTVLVLDIKSGKLRHTNGIVAFWRGHPIQIAIYAGGVGYNCDTDERYDLPWAVDQQWALIAHLDVLSALEGEPRCSLILVDLEAGRRGADLVLAARAFENTDMFGLADAHMVAAPQIARPVGDSPIPPEATATGTEPRAEQIATRMMALTIANLRDRCKAIAAMSPKGAAWLREQMVGRSLTLTGEPSPHDLTEIADLVEQAEAMVSAPFNDLLTQTNESVAAVHREPRHLARDIDEGDTWPADHPSVVTMKAAYEALDVAGRSWLEHIVSESQRANRSLHMRDGMTARRVRVVHGLAMIATAEADTDDDVVRALIALAMGSDDPLMPSIPIGDAASALTAVEAAAFVEACAALVEGRLHVDTTDGITRLRYAA